MMKLIIYFELYKKAKILFLYLNFMQRSLKKFYGNKLMKINHYETFN